MICSTCDAPVAVDSLKIWNSRTVCVDCFDVLSGQATPSQPNPENPRTIRETTVCPSCQAEFHKDHPICPECNTVLDPAYRIARQVHRVAKDVTDNVDEKTWVTRQYVNYFVRGVIGGLMWIWVAVAVIDLCREFSDLLDGTRTPNWIGMCISLVAMPWLAKRIWPGRFQIKIRAKKEDVSKPAAGSSLVVETEPIQHSPPKVDLESPKVEEKPAFPIVGKTQEYPKPVPETSNPLLVSGLLCVIFFAPLLSCIIFSGPYKSAPKRNNITASRQEIPAAKDVQEETVVLADYTNKLERVAKEVISVHGEQLTFEIPDGFGHLGSDAPDFIREYRKTVPPLVELLSLYIEDSDRARLRQGMQPLARRDISIRTLARPPITHYTQKHFDLVANAIRTAGPKAVLDAGLRLNRKMGAEDLTSRAAQGIQEEVTQLETIHYKDDCLITISMVKVAQTQDKATSVTWHAGAFAFCLRKGKIMEIRVMSRSSQRSKADLEWVTTVAKRCVHQLN